MTTRRRLLLGLAFLLLATTVVSLTIGQDIVNNRRPDLLAFGLLHFAGYLFFIVLPVELLVPWYLAEGHLAEHVVLLALGTAVSAQLIDYGIGRLLSGPVVHDLIGEARLARHEVRIRRWGWMVILLFNITPLSSPILMASAGVVQYPLRWALTWSAIGLGAKYVLMAWIFT